MTQVKSQGIAVNPVLLDRVIRGTVEGLMMTGSTPVPVGASRFQVGGGDLTVLIGLIGDYTGTMTINCTTKHGAASWPPRSWAKSRKTLNADVLDAVGEIGNMISGSFKDLMLDTKMAFTSISCPAVIIGPSATTSTTIAASRPSRSNSRSKTSRRSISKSGSSASPSP
jgi:CheY-specific phosphatase CheX